MGVLTFSDRCLSTVARSGLHYLVHKYQITQGDDQTPVEYKAIDSEPLENSFFTIPADITAGVDGSVSEEEFPFECVYVARSVGDATRCETEGEKSASTDPDDDDDDDSDAEGDDPDADDDNDTGSEAAPRSVRSFADQRSRANAVAPIRYSIDVSLERCCEHRVIAPDEDSHHNALKDLELYGYSCRGNDNAS